MRVIAGSCRSLQLKTPPGLDVRPTTDRIKETLFNIINNRIYDCNFLDMFCGSGAIGIEALSRGASKAVFVDNSQVSLDYTKANLEHTKLISDAVILKSDCVSAVSRLSTMGMKFDVIFMDPPYRKGLEEAVINEIIKYDILDENGVIIAEASNDTSFDYIEDSGYIVAREKSYGSNKHVFISKK